MSARSCRAAAGQRDGAVPHTRGDSARPQGVPVVTDFAAKSNCSGALLCKVIAPVTEFLVRIIAVRAPKGISGRE